MKHKITGNTKLIDQVCFYQFAENVYILKIDLNTRQYEYSYSQTNNFISVQIYEGESLEKFQTIQVDDDLFRSMWRLATDNDKDQIYIYFIPRIKILAVNDAKIIYPEGPKDDQ